MRSAWWLVAGIGIQLTVLFSYIHYNSATVKMTYALQREERAITALTRQRDDLLRQLEEARSLDALYVYAKEQGMQPVRLAHLIYLPSFDTKPARS